jgi:hypothetical protein
MASRVNCPICGTQIKNDRTLSGKIVNCEKCGQQFRMPTPVTPVPPPAQVSHAVPGMFEAFWSASPFNRFCGVCSSLGCFGAGLYLLTIRSERGNGTMELIAHGVGIYCIAMGFFVGPMLIAQSGKR